MADAVTTALMATIYFCVNGYATTGDKCADGSAKREQTVNLLVEAKDVHNIVEIDIDRKSVYILRANGKVTHSKDFDADQVAKEFWISLGKNFHPMCELTKDWKWLDEKVEKAKQ